MISYCICDKVLYPTRQAAMLAQHNLMLHANRQKGRMSCYACASGTGWHYGHALKVKMKKPLTSGKNGHSPNSRRTAAKPPIKSQ